MASLTKAQGAFKNTRGQELFYVKYLPTSKPVARFFFHHGIGEHSGRYDRVFCAMAQRGIAVFPFDAHGHGQSDPKADADRALIWRFGDLVDDLYTYVGVVNQAHPELTALPTFLGGVSLGGLAAAHAVLRNQSQWAGLVLQSPSLDVEWTLALKIQASISGLLSALIPRVRMVPAVRPEDMSPDPEDVKRFKEDPLIFHPPLPVRTGAEGLNAFRSLTPNYPAFTLPIYAAHGTADKCTSCPATRTFVSRVNSKDKTMREVQGGYHELLQSSCWEENTKPIIEWILARVEAQPKL